MNRQQSKKIENKMTQFILLGLVSFFMLASLLDAANIKPNLGSIWFYVFLIIVTACIYKPLLLLILENGKLIFLKLFTPTFKSIFKKQIK